MDNACENESTPTPLGSYSHLSDITPDRLSADTFFSSATTAATTPQNNSSSYFDPSITGVFLKHKNSQDYHNGPQKDSIVTSKKSDLLLDYSINTSAFDNDFNNCNTGYLSTNNQNSTMSPKTIDKLLKSDAAMELLQLLANNSYSNNSTPQPSLSPSLPGLLPYFYYPADFHNMLASSPRFNKEDNQRDFRPNDTDNIPNSLAAKSTINQFPNKNQDSEDVKYFNLQKDKKKAHSKIKDQIRFEVKGEERKKRHTKKQTAKQPANETNTVKNNTNDVLSYSKLLDTLPQSEKIFEDIEFFLSDNSINLDLFKAIPCHNISLVHNRKNCFYFHSQRDRRRHYSLYKAEQCEDHFDVDDDFVCVCRNGDNCNKCHNRHELLYHPSIYKQRFCSSYNQKLKVASQCHRGQLCAFAHSRSEIRSQLFSDSIEKSPDAAFFMMEFKTYWCPYGLQHDWHECLYAHTYQDCRRSPLIGYGSEPCPYWKKDLHCENYQKRCLYGINCPYSHGSKEQLYHPAYYKTMPCADFKAKNTCPRGNLCAFYHDIKEKRTVVTTQINNLVKSINASPTNFNDMLNSDDNKSKLEQYIYDYSKPLNPDTVSKLQSNFMCPPLFNLDDFEAFGHTSNKNVSNNHQNNNFNYHPKDKGVKLPEIKSRGHQQVPMMPYNPINNRNAVASSYNDFYFDYGYLM